MTETQKALAVMTAVFRNFTTEQALVYDGFLRDIPAPVLKKAIESLIKTAKFPPTVAEIREEARKVYGAAKGQKRPDASAAWERAQRGMSRWGSTRLAEFLAELAAEGDNLTAEAIKRFGWEAFGLVPPDGMNTARAQFMKIYNEIAAHRTEEKHLTHLIADGAVQAMIAQVSTQRALPQ